MTRIYLDTSVISALYDERTPERLAQTRQAWTTIVGYEVCISDLVLNELSHTSDEIKEGLLKSTSGFTVLETNKDAFALASEYVALGVFPEKYFDDALHVAIATLNNIGILLSWNFAHLVKVKTRRMVAFVNAGKNFLPVEIISPPEL